MQICRDSDNTTLGLLAEVSNGSQVAFNKLVKLYWNKVYSHSLAYSKSTFKAQEITQDIFLRVWQKKETLTQIQDFDNYLFILSRNHIISAMRKKLLETSIDNEYVEGLLEDILLPDQQLQLKQTYETVIHGIDEMPPTRKKVFILSRFEGKTYNEIAGLMHISKNTVKEHITSGLSFLRKYVQSHSNLLLTLACCIRIVINIF